MPNHLHGIIILQDGDGMGDDGDADGRGEASGKYLVFEPRISFPDASPLLNRGCRPFAVLGPVDRVGNNIPADAFPFFGAADDMVVIIALP